MCAGSVDRFDLDTVVERAQDPQLAPIQSPVAVAEALSPHFVFFSFLVLRDHSP